MKFSIILLLYGDILFNGALALNILGVFPYQGKSHFYVFEPYLRELAKRGHNMTVISYFPQKETLENYRDISLAGKAKIYENVLPLDSETQKNMTLINFFLFDVGTENCKTLLGTEEVQQLWKSKAKFDLVLVEQFNSDCSLGLAYQLGAPVVGLTSHILVPFTFARFGINNLPLHLTFGYLEGGTNPSLSQRIERTLIYAYMTIGHKYLNQQVDENTLVQYFNDVPPLEELGRNIKVILIYTHHTLSSSLLYPPNVIEVGGYHVATPKELPKDIKKFMDESEHGIIYISFGSLLRAASTPRDKLEVIIATLSELPQRVIWKWEESSLPGNPKNIYFSNWLPQNDILAHPKVLAFYSHCGLLGTTEALYHGVPMIGMPIFGDQPANAAAVEESGLGVQIQINQLNKEELLKKFKTVLDPKFRQQVKVVSRAWHDRPMSAMDSAIYWTEYAARTANFTFRTRAAFVPYYQSSGIDVLAVLAAVGIGFLLALRFAISLCCRGKPVQKPVKSKRN